MIMKNNTKTQLIEMVDLAEDARALLEATSNLTGQKVQKARKRLALTLKHVKSTGEDVADTSGDMATDAIHELRERISSAMDNGKEIYDDVHDDIVSRTKAANHALRDHPYPVMGISLGVGAIVGFLISLGLSRR